VKLFLPLNFDNTFDNSLRLKTFHSAPKGEMKKPLKNQGFLEISTVFFWCSSGDSNPNKI